MFLLINIKNRDLLFFHKELHCVWDQVGLWLLIFYGRWFPSNINIDNGIFLSPPLRTVCNTKSIFKRSKDSLFSKFSISRLKDIIREIIPWEREREREIYTLSSIVWDDFSFLKDLNFKRFAYLCYINNFEKPVHCLYLRNHMKKQTNEMKLQGDQKKKKKKKEAEPIYFWLKSINLILAFSFFQDMK